MPHGKPGRVGSVRALEGDGTSIDFARALTEDVALLEQFRPERGVSFVGPLASRESVVSSKMRQHFKS